MARKNADIAVNLLDDGRVSFEFSAADLDGIVIDPSALSPEIVRRAMIHGLVQKVSDAAALPKTDGQSASLSDKHAAMTAVAERLVAGEWSKRSGDGSDSAPAGLIFRALCEFKAGSDPVKLREWYDAKSRSEQLALRNVPAIAEIMERIRAEKATKTVDVDSLLDGLDDLD